MKLLLLLWTLTFHLPTHDAARTSPVPFSCHDTTTAGQLHDLHHLNIYTYFTQSPTWVKYHAAMERWPAFWELLWPTVASEATPHPVVQLLCRGQEGQLVTVAMPDSLPLGARYYVTTVDDSLNESCRSNEVTR